MKSDSENTSVLFALWDRLPQRRKFLAWWLMVMVLLLFLFSVFPGLFFVVLILLHLLIFFPVYVRAKIRDGL